MGSLCKKIKISTFTGDSVLEVSAFGSCPFRTSKCVISVLRVDLGMRWAFCRNKSMILHWELCARCELVYLMFSLICNSKINGATSGNCVNIAVMRRASLSSSESEDVT